MLTVAELSQITHTQNLNCNSWLISGISDNKEVFTGNIGASTLVCSEKNVGVASPPPFPCVAILGGTITARLEASSTPQLQKTQQTVLWLWSFFTCLVMIGQPIAGFYLDRHAKA